MNDNRKWLIGFGIVGVLCLCAGVVAVLVFGLGVSQVASSVKTDPASVAAEAQKIADFDVPQGYHEAMAMSFFGYDIVGIFPDNYAGSSGAATNGVIIMLMQFNAPGMDEAQMQQQMQQSLQQQSGQRGINMKVVSTYQTTIRGQSSTVTIQEGDSSQGFTLRQLVTVFPGKAGTVMLMVQGPSTAWDQTLIDQFIASIR
jgi:hypothetical protein